jgi:hypothetical protein
MTDTLEDSIKTALGRAAGSVEPPTEIVGSALVEGRKAVRRRHWTVASAAVVVLAVASVVSGVFVGLPGERAGAPSDRTHVPSVPAPATATPAGAPASLDDLPQGALPAVPYVAQGKLWFPSGSVSLTQLPVERGSSEPYSLSVAGRDALLTFGYPSYLLRVSPDGSVQVVDRNLTGLVAVDQSGSLAAWVRTTGVTGREAVLYDLDRGVVVARHGYHENVRSHGLDDSQVVGLLDDGEAFILSGLHMVRWSVASGSTTWSRTPGRARGGYQYLSAAGRTMASADSHGRLVLDTKADGLPARTLPLSIDPVGGLSPDGEWFLSILDFGAVAVSMEPQGGQVRFDLPQYAHVVQFAWESPAAVLLAVGGFKENQALVRCSVGSGQCERVLGSLGLPGRSILPNESWGDLNY